MRRESDVSMAGVFALQLNVLREAVDNLGTKVDEFDDTLTEHSLAQKEFFEKPVILFLEKTDRMWILLNKIADVILRSAEAISKAIRWMVKNIMPIVGFGVFIWVAVRQDVATAWEKITSFWP